MSAFGLVGFLLVVGGVVGLPRDRRSQIAGGALILGFIIMSYAGWRAFQ